MLNWGGAVIGEGKGETPLGKRNCWYGGSFGLCLPERLLAPYQPLFKGGEISGL